MAYSDSSLLLIISCRKQSTGYAILLPTSYTRNDYISGMRKNGFVRGCYSEHKAKFLRKSHLVAPTFPPFPPTRFILEPPAGGTEKPLFLLRALPQKNSDFSVLTSEGFHTELLVWHPPGARATLGARAEKPRASSGLTIDAPLPMPPVYRGAGVWRQHCLWPLGLALCCHPTGCCCR